jgi:hypothetical protein
MKGAGNIPRLFDNGNKDFLRYYLNAIRLV